MHTFQVQYTFSYAIHYMLDFAIKTFKNAGASRVSPLGPQSGLCLWLINWGLQVATRSLASGDLFTPPNWNPASTPDNNEIVNSISCYMYYLMEDLCDK